MSSSSSSRNINQPEQTRSVANLIKIINAAIAAQNAYAQAQAQEQQRKKALTAKRASEKATKSNAPIPVASMPDEEKEEKQANETLQQTQQRANNAKKFFTAQAIQLLKSNIENDQLTDSLNTLNIIKKQRASSTLLLTPEEERQFQQQLTNTVVHAIHKHPTATTLLHDTDFFSPVMTVETIDNTIQQTQNSLQQAQQDAANFQNQQQFATATERFNAAIESANKIVELLTAISTHSSDKITLLNDLDKKIAAAKQTLQDIQAAANAADAARISAEKRAAAAAKAAANTKTTTEQKDEITAQGLKKLLNEIKQKVGEITQKQINDVIGEAKEEEAKRILRYLQAESQKKWTLQRSIELQRYYERLMAFKNADAATPLAADAKDAEQMNAYINFFDAKLALNLDQSEIIACTPETVFDVIDTETKKIMDAPPKKSGDSQASVSNANPIKDRITQEITDNRARISTIQFKDNKKAVYTQRVRDDEVITELWATDRNPETLLQLNTTQTIDGITFIEDDTKNAIVDNKLNITLLNKFLREYLEERRKYHEPITQDSLEKYLSHSGDPSDSRPNFSLCKKQIASRVWNNYAEGTYSKDATYSRFFYPYPFFHDDLLKTAIKIIEAEMKYIGKDGWPNLRAKDKPMAELMVGYCASQGYNYVDSTGYNVAKNPAFKAMVKTIKKRLEIESSVSLARGDADQKVAQEQYEREHPKQKPPPP